MKKNIIIGLGAALLLALGGCAQKDNSAEASDGQKTIGVLQLVQHNSLDAAYKGFKEGLAEEGYKEGDNLTIDYQNAQNNQDNLKSMSEKLVKEDPDLLLGIATPAAQSLLNETTTIPMTVTAVTDLEQAHLVTSNEKPGGNVTGTTDMVPIEKQIGLLLNIVPDAKTIGIMYNNGEANGSVNNFV